MEYHVVDVQLRPNLITHRKQVNLKLRSEMSDLLSSLRSLLPQEYVAGETSTCDDIEEATNYIKNLEASIKELQHKRKMLLIIKKSPSSSSSTKHNQIIGSSPSNSSNNDDDDHVRIHKYPTRFEIEISVKHEEGDDAFPLSKLVKQVSSVEGIEVVNCLSSKAHQRWRCIIHCDLVNDGATIDFSELQTKLATEISSYAN